MCFLFQHCHFEQQLYLTPQWNEIWQPYQIYVILFRLSYCGSQLLQYWPRIIERTLCKQYCKQNAEQYSQLQKPILIIQHQVFLTLPNYFLQFLMFQCSGLSVIIGCRPVLTNKSSNHQTRRTNHWRCHVERLAKVGNRNIEQKTLLPLAINKCND